MGNSSGYEGMGRGDEADRSAMLSKRERRHKAAKVGGLRSRRAPHNARNLDAWVKNDGRHEKTRVSVRSGAG